MSKLRDALTGWAKDADVVTPAPEAPVEDVTPIAEANDRERIRMRGTLRTVTMRPRGGTPAIEAELFDGTDVVTVVWLGRRHITGIAPGVALEVQGRIGRHDGVRTIYNPRYELIP
jgi:RecG-like helicase